MTDIRKLTFIEFTEIVSKINFAPTSDQEIKKLLFECRQLHKFACDVVVDCRAENNSVQYIPNMLKQFVLKNKDTSPTIYKFLSYVVCFPTTEAVVESCGSFIDRLHKNKPNTMEELELPKTGTVDQLAFLKLNGPPPGSLKNRKMYKTALNLLFKGDCASHFLHLGRDLQTTSLVVDRILNVSPDNLQPCFLD